MLGQFSLERVLGHRFRDCQIPINRHRYFFNRCLASAQLFVCYLPDLGIVFVRWLSGIGVGFCFLIALLRCRTMFISCLVSAHVFVL